MVYLRNRKGNVECTIALRLLTKQTHVACFSVAEAQQCKRVQNAIFRIRLSRGHWGQQLFQGAFGLDPRNCQLLQIHPSCGCVAWAPC